MVLDTRIDLRTSKEQKVLFEQYCHSKGIKMSFLIVCALLEHIKNNPSSHTEEKKIIERLEQEKRLEIAREIHKKNMYNKYFINNILKQLFVVARASMINSNGKGVNMKMICSILKSAKQVYDELPKEDKNIYRSDIKELQNWKKLEYVYDKIKFINFIKRGEQHKRIGG